MFELNETQIKRYQRNILLSQVGIEGQKKLCNSKVLVVGAGGLGSPVIYYLAAAGIGNLGLIDNDKIEISNLQRQIIHNMGDINKRKVFSAAEKVKKLNPEIEIKAYQERLQPENAAQIIAEYQMVVDCTDNFPTRHIINKACLEAQKPFIHGGVLGFQGQVMTFFPGQGPCFSCLFPQEPRAKIEGTGKKGIIGAAVGLIGSIQAAETIKLLLNTGEPLIGRLLTVNLLTMSFEEVEVKKDPSCSICSEY